MSASCQVGACTPFAIHLGPEHCRPESNFPSKPLRRREMLVQWTTLNAKDPTAKWGTESGSYKNSTAGKTATFTRKVGSTDRTLDLHQCIAGRHSTHACGGAHASQSSILPVPTPICLSRPGGFHRFFV